MNLAEELAAAQTALWKEGETESERYRALILLSVRLSLNPSEEGAILEEFNTLTAVAD